MPRKIILSDSDEESTDELLCSDEECGEPNCEASVMRTSVTRLNVARNTILIKWLKRTHSFTIILHINVKLF